MTDGIPRKIDKAARHRERRRGRLLGLNGEQLRFAPLDLPDHRARGHTSFGEVAGCITPSIEIVFGRQTDAVVIDHWTVRQHLASSFRQIPKTATLTVPNTTFLLQMP